MKARKALFSYWPIVDHSIVDELFLDQKNIRLPISGSTQSALIQDLFSNEDAFDLVKSFVQNGLFPDEFPIVAREKGKLVVIEGNRRLAALKALNEPDIVPSFKEKIKSFPNPKIITIKVVVAPSRDAAIKHIANKHTINYRRPWKPLRQAYFYKSQLDNNKTINQLKEDYPEHDIPKFIRMLEMHHMAKSENFMDSSIMAKIHDERKFPITTLERMYESPHIQEAFGFSFNSTGKFQATIEKAEFEKGFRKLIEDVATGEIDSRKTNNSEQIQKYIETLPVDYRPNKNKKGKLTSRNFKEIKFDNPIGQKTHRSSPIPEGLFLPSHIPFKLQNSGLRFLYDELKDINVKKFPNATFDLLRSFLECSLIVFLKQINEYSEIKNSERHNPKLGEMLSHIINGNCKYITDTNIIDVVKQIKTNYDSPYSLERMNMANHNENWNSTEKDVRSAWGKIESLIKIILNPIQSGPNSKQDK
jgi:hypothetical protein